MKESSSSTNRSLGGREAVHAMKQKRTGLKGNVQWRTMGNIVSSLPVPIVLDLIGILLHIIMAFFFLVSIFFYVSTMHQQSHGGSNYNAYTIYYMITVVVLFIYFILNCLLTFFS